MKYRKLLPFKFKSKWAQSGQAVVEYVMLLAVMSLITYSFTAVVSKYLRSYWEHAANLVVEDKPGVKTYTFK